MNKIEYKVNCKLRMNRLVLFFLLHFPKCFRLVKNVTLYSVEIAGRKEKFKVCEVLEPKND